MGTVFIVVVSKAFVGVCVCMCVLYFIYLTYFLTSNGFHSVCHTVQRISSGMNASHHFVTSINISIAILNGKFYAKSGIKQIILMKITWEKCRIVLDFIRAHHLFSSTFQPCRIYTYIGFTFFPPLHFALFGKLKFLINLPNQ